ncbi:MAG: thioredoxin family protein [Proteobacteria bacterium]|nr:thioredoxin family protein [Pseudomonadota bacterium]MBU4383910.1 thioredoxin family protein [Pseudomonadota bacterium]MCG2763550.1 thioredoxin family protein [Desulfarculaceae bacterium]
MSDTELMNLDTAGFKSWVASHDGIIIFHKKLCPHCKVMRTVLAKVKIQIPEIALATVDSEEYPEIMAEASVEHVPTLCAVKGGQVQDRQTGVFNPKETIAFYKKA